MAKEETKRQQEEDMEKRILEAAGKVFMLKGRLGTSMQDIADEAGINRTLLHYYFRSKEKLFENVFRKVMSRIFPALVDALLSSMPFQEKLEQFINTYSSLIQENPFLPVFVFQEMQINPERIAGMIHEGGVDPERTLAGIREELTRLGLDDMDPRHLFADMMGMVLFPFIGRPLFEAIAFQGDKDAYDDFLLERHQHIPDLLSMALSHGKTQNSKNNES